MRLIENGQNFGENQVKNKKYLQKQKVLCIGLKRLSGLVCSIIRYLPIHLHK
jgi:hypothetical protein